MEAGGLLCFCRASVIKWTLMCLKGCTLQFLSLAITNEAKTDLEPLSSPSLIKENTDKMILDDGVS